MTLLDIRLHPDPILRKVTEPVAEITPGILTLLDDMVETMREAPGIGLAAPQVGIAKRLFVVDHGLILDRENDDDEVEIPPLKVINPEIVETTGEETVLEEGCLSLPQVAGNVTRPAQVTMRYTDAAGSAQEITADGLLAKCLQHEFDHLNGVMFFDHMSTLKRNMLLKRFKKLQRR